MQNSGSTLQYQSTSTSTTIGNSQISIASGTGKTYTYGTSYYPRNWSGEVFYHYGSNPTGDCASPRIPVSVIVSQPTLDLGADTTLDYSQSITLMSNNSFDSYLWSDNSTAPQITVDTATVAATGNAIWLEATNQLGCSITDTIHITFEAISSNYTNINSYQNISIAPNPTSGPFSIVGIENTENITFDLINSNGVIVEQFKINPNESIDLSHLARGYYFISFVNQGQRIFRKIILN
jgi:hypothetical protein